MRCGLDSNNKLRKLKIPGVSNSTNGIQKKQQKETHQLNSEWLSKIKKKKKEKKKLRHHQLQ